MSSPLRRPVALAAVACMMLAPWEVRADEPAPTPDLRAIVPGANPAPAVASDPLATRIRSLRSRRRLAFGLTLAGGAGFVVSSAFVLGPVARNAGCVADPTSGLQGCDRSSPKLAGVVMIGFAAVAATGLALFISTHELPAAVDRWTAEHPGELLEPPEPRLPKPAEIWDPTRPQ